MSTPVLLAALVCLSATPDELELWYEQPADATGKWPYQGEFELGAASILIVGRDFDGDGVNDVVVGVINVNNKTSGDPFGPDDLSLLSSFSERISRAHSVTQTWFSQVAQTAWS